MKKHNFLTGNTIIAHRGVYNNEKGIIENTIPAFCKAMQCKYIIELDIHIIKDNTVVVFHDDNLKRLTGINRKIKEYTYKELKKVKLRNTTQHIPKLEEVLQLVNGKVPLLIELKYDRFIGKLEKELANLLKKYNGDYAIQSFNPLSIIWFRIKKPDVLRGQITTNISYNIIKKYVIEKMFLNFFSKPDFISFNINNVKCDKIKKFKSQYIVLGWTVKTQVEFLKLKNCYDNLICENFI